MELELPVPRPLIESQMVIPATEFPNSSEVNSDDKFVISLTPNKDVHDPGFTMKCVLTDKIKLH